MSNKNPKIVSYNVAKMLKANGFNEDVCFRIYPDGSIATNNILCDYNNSHYKDCCSAPTLSEVVDWFLDKHEIFIEIDYIRIPYNFGKKFKYFVIDVNDENGFGGDIIMKSDDAFATRDEAILHAVTKLLSKMTPIEMPITTEEKNTFSFDGVEVKIKTEKIEVL